MFLADVVVGHHPRRLARQLGARKAGNRLLVGQLTLHAHFRFLVVIGHEAAVDEEVATVGKLQRRVDVIAGLAAPGGEEVPLPAVVVDAACGDPAILDVAALRRHGLDIGQRNRRRLAALGDVGEQAFLPVQPLDLPCAERDEDGERDSDRDARQDRQLAARRRVSSVSHGKGVLRGHCGGIAWQSERPCTSAAKLTRG